MPASSPADPALPVAFYARDTVVVARELLGCVLASTVDGVTVSGRIVETEAYLGADDAGSHAATRGITARNSVMYGAPGRAYVYFTYGSHHMLNVVTEPEGSAGAVLVRALEPLAGIETMRVRRARGRRDGALPPLREIADGPGKLAAALGIGLGNNGEPLDGSATLSVFAGAGTGGAVATSGRVGLSSGHEAELRFFFEDDPYVSRGRTGRRRPAASRDRKV
jgi:DNA-3-methyladenine glycosylase